MSTAGIGPISDYDAWKLANPDDVEPETFDDDGSDLDPEDFCEQCGCVCDDCECEGFSDPDDGCREGEDVNTPDERYYDLADELYQRWKEGDL